VASVLLLALAGGAAVFATISPASAASLTAQLDPELAAFLVPLGLLALVLLIEITRFTFTGRVPAERRAEVRPIRAWASEHQRR
jgi:asparagine N-glycosylation enzyme membrane subunit Stt3